MKTISNRPAIRHRTFGHRLNALRLVLAPLYAGDGQNRPEAGIRSARSEGLPLVERWNYPVACNWSAAPEAALDAADRF